MADMTRRRFVHAGAAGIATLTVGHDRHGALEQGDSPMDESSVITIPGRLVVIDAKPAPITIDTAKTAIVVVDMQNDFGSKGGMFDRMGLDVAMIQGIVGPIARVLVGARGAGMKIVYLKMGFRSDLSDLGAPGSPNREGHLRSGVGKIQRGATGVDSRTLIRDTWGTDIVADLAPLAADLVIYKHRYSGFYQTELDATLRRLGVTYLIFTGCTTSVCVESTVRDASFRDYSPIVLADCTAEPIGHGLARTNREASLLTIEAVLGWVSNSGAVLKGLNGSATTGEENR